jgi:nucleotide-binding universal stress UspA family protein
MVITIIKVPRSFLETIREERWHPLGDSFPEWTSEEDAMIARYVEERGHRLTEPLLGALRTRGIDAAVRYLEGEDPAGKILEAAGIFEADLVVLGATKHLFAEWESVSARVLRDSTRPVLVVPSPPRESPDRTEE